MQLKVHEYALGRNIILLNSRNWLYKLKTLQFHQKTDYSLESVTIKTNVNICLGSVSLV